MATGATEFIDVTTADAFLGEVWAKECTVAREKKLVFGGLVDRSLEKDLSKGQIVRKQEISNLAARSKTANTAITYETVTETEGTVTVNNHYYAAFAVEDIIKVQSMQNLRERYTGKLGYALALQEDDDLAALIDDGTITQTVGTLATGLSFDNLVRGDQYLNDADVPLDDRYIVVSPAEKANFLKMPEFTNKDYNSGNSVVSGALGEILGYKIHVTTNVDGDNSNGHDNCMFHKEALAIVSQIQPKVMSQYDIDYLCDKVVAQELYGAGILRADHAVWMKGA